MKRISSSKLAVWGLLLLAASAVFAQMPQPFAADFTSTMHNGEKMTGKWFFSPPNMRVDMNSMPGHDDQGPMAGPVSMIMDNATQTHYMVLHGPHMYMESHGDQKSMSPGLRDLLRQKPGVDPCGGRTDCTSKKIGTESVNGRSCDKWEVTEKSGKSTLWIDQKLHFPIKMQGTDGYTMELSNIKEGAQDPSLFKVPAGYKAFDPSAFGGQRRPK